MELLALGKPIKKPPRSDERDGELFCGTPVTMEIDAWGRQPYEHYGRIVLNAGQHNFTSLKIVSYTNLSISHSNYPQVIINNSSHVRPAIGTTYDIGDKTIDITCLTENASYQKTGIIVELS